ncbi:MAG: hypothetical protein H0W42_11445 [Gemmatimonadaceae bacterium]|nr:hypothetical protein [Gemmatimonadaceae bacterium]
MKIRSIILRAAVALSAASALTPADAQQPAAADSAATGKPRVFIDCERCDDDFLREDIAWIDHVRDRAVADVHVLVTAQRTGSGGTEYTANFIGLRQFSGKQDTLSYFSRVAESSDQTRRGISAVLKLGLVRYAARSPVASTLMISGRAEGPGVAALPVRDRWNLWVFRTSARGFFNGEKTSKAGNLFGSVSANRISPAWKTNFGMNINYSENKFTFNDGRKFNNYSRGYGATSLIVKSLGPQWSVGQRASVSSSTFLNQELAARVAPAIEYNFFPYAESTRRQLTLQYSAGLNHFRYEDTTIYNEIRETLGDQALIASLDVKQPWGSVSTSLEAAAFIHDFSKQRLVFFTNLDWRLIKGLSVSLSGNASLIRDQLYIAGGELSDEQVLLRRRQLATSYRYFVSAGLSYSFGSIYSNVVNSRFGGTSGGTVFFF